MSHSRSGHWIALVFLLVAAAVILVEWFLYRAIRRQAGRDEARPAGAIVVLGAAEYDGQPSPVFKARLDHAFDLEEKGFAPLVVTTGAGGGDPRFTEAGVGRDYLIQKGMAAAKILSDPRSETTVESVQTVAQMLRKLGAKTCIVVSDGFHLYRITLMFRAHGIAAYGSPAPDSPIEADPYLRTLYSLREMLVSSLWYLGYRG